MAGEERDHPSLSDYPDSPVGLYTDENGVTGGCRCSVTRTMQYRFRSPISPTLAQLRYIIEQVDGLEDWRLELIGLALASTRNEPNPPRTRAEVYEAVENLRKRVQHWLPYW